MSSKAIPTAALLVSLVIAGTGAAAPEKSASKGVTLLHWWTSSSERAAVEALGEVFKKRHPDLPLTVTVADSHGGGPRMFSIVKSAAAGGNPPDAFQIHVGASLRPYFDAGLLTPIDAVWSAEGLDKVVPPVLQTMSQIDGHYYALPINVHRNNLIWYNKPLLDKHHVDPNAIATWDDLFKAASTLEAAGVKSPLQLGTEWTASVAFESIIASLGVDHYEDWINGKMTDAGDPRLLKSFGILKSYLSHANPDHATTPWDVAVKRVVDGEAAFCIMGDWANGEFRLAKMTYGRDYGVITVPGTKGLYGATVDAFAQARGTASAESSARFMRTAASREGQDAFNVAKGSISARTDADVSKYDAYQKSAIADFKAAKVIYPNLASATHDAFKLSLDGVMTVFAEDLDVKKAAATIAGAAARSQKKFTRVWSLR